MASQTFPSIKPSGREFTLGTYPVRTYTSLAGTTVKRSFGNKPHSYQLTLSFENIDDSKLDQLLAHYEATEGGFVRFKLPNAVFAGMNNSVRERIQSPDGIQWEYASPPNVQSVYNGISSVSIELLGELNV